MLISNQVSRTVILYHFKKSTKAEDAANDINDTFDEHVTKKNYLELV